ncbi:hypothetical protein NSTCB13_05534 [Nostoc sp. DSM 114160]|jgi:hypothetical protein
MHHYQNMDKLSLCIRQFGEAARLHLDEAILLGEMCLLPNFCHEPNTYEVISAFVNSVNSRTLYWGRSSMGEITVFAKPINNSYDKDRISTLYIANLLKFSRRLYPEMEHYSFGKFWDELDVYRHSEFLNQDAFEMWMSNFGHEPNLEIFLKRIIPKMFGQPNQNISFYCLVNDENENTDFAPYIFIGNSCILTIARRWIL